MSKKLVEILKKKEQERIEAHMPAKNAPVLSEDELSSLQRFEKAYEQAWLDSRDTSRNVETDGFHASSLGISVGACGRRNVYLLRGVEKQNIFDARILRVFANGHAVHERIQNMLEGMGLNAESEIPIVYEEPPIRGHADGVIEWEGRKILIEIKSCSSTVFNNRLQWKAPKKEHVAQANIYAYVLGLDYIWVIYECKDCVPENSRALTRDGWKYHYELAPGDEIMTYNIDRHEMEWEPYSGNKLVYELNDEPIYRVGNKHQSFLATYGHRWAVKDHNGERSVRYTHELNSNSWVPFHAPYAFDGESVLDEKEAEILGWLVTDGWISNGQYYICQSKSKGVDRISELLSDVEHSHREYDQVTPVGDNLHMHYFNIMGELREKFKELLPSKSDLPSVVTRLGVAELEALYRGMLGGDGSWSSSGHGEQLCQLDGPVKTAFQIVCTLLGKRLNLNHGKVSCYPGTREWMRTYHPVEESYTGKVWCPQTTNGFWLMEQDGKVVITGNTQNTKIFEVKTDVEAAEKQISKWHAEWLCFKDGELPKRPYKPGSPTCSGCDLKNVCLPDAEVGVDLKKYKEQVKEIRGGE